MKILGQNHSHNKKENEYPLIPLREMVVFPGMVKSFYVGRYESIESVNLSLSYYDKMIFLITQKDSNIENPDENSLHDIGTISQIVEVKPGPDKKIIKLLVKGVERAIFVKMTNEGNLKKSLVSKIENQILDNSIKSEALINFVVKEFKRFSSFAKIPDEVLQNISRSDNEGILLNMIVPHIKISLDKQVELLEEIDLTKRYTILSELIIANVELLEIEKK